MKLKVECPNCSFKKNIPASCAGKTIRCSKCLKTFLVPMDQILQKSDRSPNPEAIDCPYCAEEIKAAAVKCKHCGEFLNRPRRKTRLARPVEYVHYHESEGFTLTTLAGLAGIILIIIGTFCPTFTIPMIGNMNFYSDRLEQLGLPGQGYIMVMFAALAGLILWLRATKMLWLPGCLALSCLGFFYKNYSDKFTEAKGKVETAGGGQVVSEIAASFVKQLFHPQWGFYLMVTGAVILIATSLLVIGSE